MRLVYNAQFCDVSGYGKCARDYLRALDMYIADNPGALELRINIVSFTPERCLSDDEQELIKKYIFKSDEERQEWLNSEFIFMGHQTPNVVLSHETNKPFVARAKKVINYTVWEVTGLPESWCRMGQRGDIDAFIVPCEWNKDIFESDTGVETFVVPHVVPSPAKVEPADFGDGFKILAVSTWMVRKGWEKLVKAYLMEFNDTDAKLIIKSYVGSADKRERDFIRAEIARYRHDVVMPDGQKSNAKIIFIGDLLTIEEMASLYAGCNCFALASHGEGFGLPYSEAIAHGLPCVAPDKGGHLDFMTAEDNYLFNSYFDSCHGMPVFYDCGMDWVDFRIADIRDALRAAYEDFTAGELRKPSIKDHDFEHIGKMMVDVLLEIEGGTE